MLCIDNVDIKNKKILIRVDFNVPIIDGNIIDVSRIEASVPTINYALNQNAAIILISHLGDPVDNLNTSVLQPIQDLSLKIVVPILEKFLNKPVKFISDWFDKNQIDINLGQVVLCENIRLITAEKQNNPEFAKKLAEFADVVIMDAFATAHRLHASTYGILNYARVAAAGFLLYKEVNVLHQALLNPVRPLVAVVGGAKLSTKLKVLKSLSEIADYLIVGGAIANTCLLAKGYNIGASLCDNNLLDLAQSLDRIVLPEDAVALNANGVIEQKDIQLIDELDCILDIGEKTIKKYQTIINQANTVLWNGPMGKIEDPRFANGTQWIANAILENKGLSIVGGGDTLGIIKQFKLDGFSCVSTGGGAFLEFIENHTLPMIELLNKFG